MSYHGVNGPILNRFSFRFFLFLIFINNIQNNHRKIKIRSPKYTAFMLMSPGWVSAILTVFTNNNEIKPFTIATPYNSSKLNGKKKGHMTLPSKIRVLLFDVPVGGTT